MLNQVKNLVQANNSTLPLTSASRNEASLLTFLESLQPKWVRMCFKRGQYELQLSLGKGKYHYAQGQTPEELLENLKQRLQRYGVAC